MIKSAPKIVVRYLGDCNPETPFLRIRHLNLQLEYPDGSLSEEFDHDVIVRSKMDAVVICAYDLSNPDEPKIWLRSCVRPSVCSRDDFPNSGGSGWELPAGLVDEGESPSDTAVRELKEEVGFDVPMGYRWNELGVPAWGSVGIAPELVYFYMADVTGLERSEPTEDGSPLERQGDCTLVTFEEAKQVGDMKTCLGAHRMQEWLNKNLIRLGNYVTKTRHDKYSAGTGCVAYRLLFPYMLLLQMNDGTIIQLPPPWHCPGLEPSIGICAEEDQEVFNMIDRAVGSRGVVE